MLTNRKYSGRRPLVVVAALLSLMILLPLAGCKNDTVPEPTRYTVKFDKNAKDATGEMASQTFIEGVEQELSANQFKRDTWTFSGWSEDKAATTATYGDKDKFKATKDTTLYAVWTDNGTVASVTFTPADGTTLYYGDTVTLSTTDGATIQYHLGDGSWQDYTVGTPIPVTTSTTITAKATKAGLKDRETTASYTVRQLTAITVTSPTRTVYSVGDTFDSTGMTVTATYDDETTREVTESATTDFDSKSAGVKTVTVSYSEDGITKDGSFKVGVIGEATYQFTETVQDVDSTYTGTMSGGTYKKFGDWPQTVMGSDVMVGEKKIIRGGLDFYVGTDGNYYVEAKENAYATGTGYQYSNEEQAGQGGTTTKWFKVEPIVWRVLTENYATTGTALLLAENILTGGIPYYVDTNQRTITGAGTDGGDTVYANNYQYSTVRAWLNGKYESDDTQTQTYTNTGFLQTAFTTSAQGLIAETTVDNSAASTNPPSNPQEWNSGNNPYASDTPTKDKVFLLSEKEAITSGYGFSTYNTSGPSTNRIRATTDYAKATGAYQSSAEDYGGWWWLRSPNFKLGSSVCNIYYNGYAYFSYNAVNVTNEGVVPALCVQLQ